MKVSKSILPNLPRESIIKNKTKNNKKSKIIIKF